MRDIISEQQDLRHLRWSERANTSGTAGCFLKAREETGGTLWYYKLSCYDSYRGVYGHECANEIIASRLMDLFSVPHLSYKLIHALVLIDDEEREVWLNRSKNFRVPGEKKLAFDTFYDLEKQHGESPLDLAERFGWSQQLQHMMIVDYLIVNRDRHGANIEVLRDKEGKVRLAPLFDNGLSLVFSCYEDESRAAAFDPLQDVNVNNYIGTRSLEENVRRFVSREALQPFLKRRLSDEDVIDLLKGLKAVLPEAHREKISQIIRMRWNELENLCHS